MPSDTSARLSLPYLAAGQLQKHVTLNQALTRLDVLSQTAVISRTTSAQPAGAADGDLYVLPTGSTGADWSTRAAGDLMRAETGGWTRIVPVEGMIATVLDADVVLVRRSGTWTALATGEGGGEPEPPTALQNLTRLGINATADATNPFSARLNKALWTAREASDGGDGDLRMTFNKQAEADVLSLLFQSGYGARAELGLIGDDDFRLKVSPDGVTWHDALVVDAATGTVQVTGAAASAGLQTQTTVLSTNATYSIPAWAKHLQVTAIGGGGGGGSGMASTSASTRFGGGGGGAGGLSTACWPRASLGATLAIVVGAGGAGGATVASGNGLTGATGVSTSIASGSTTLLTATGGAGGQGGSTGSGNGGAGGRGVQISNSGASSAVSTTVLPADSLTRSDGSGGGGGGGGLSSGGTARAGGNGGTGSVLHLASDGGSGGNNAVGGTGVAPTDLMLGLGSGGGGGGANGGGPGFSGGAGTAGSGGGGGGVGATASGAGGNGGNGLVRVMAIG